MTKNQSFFHLLWEAFSLWGPLNPRLRRFVMAVSVADFAIAAILGSWIFLAFGAVGVLRVLLQSSESETKSLQPAQEDQDV